MISFKEFMKLNESPNGVYGEWSGDDQMRLLGVTLRDDVLERRWELLDEIDGIRFYLKTSKDSAVGINKDNQVIIHLIISSIEIHGDSGLEGKQTNMVKIDDNYRDNKNATKLYSLLLEKGYVLVSDYTQYDGARALWKSLGRGDKFYSYTFNEITGKIIKQEDFDDKDSELWSFQGASKEYLLLVLSKKSLDKYL